MMKRDWHQHLGRNYSCRPKSRHFVAHTRWKAASLSCLALYLCQHERSMPTFLDSTIYHYKHLSVWYCMRQFPSQHKTMVLAFGWFSWLSVPLPKVPLRLQESHRHPDLPPSRYCSNLNPKFVSLSFIHRFISILQLLHQQRCSKEGRFTV